MSCQIVFDFSGNFPFQYGTDSYKVDGNPSGKFLPWWSSFPFRFLTGTPAGVLLVLPYDLGTRDDRLRDFKFPVKFQSDKIFLYHQCHTCLRAVKQKFCRHCDKIVVRLCARRSYLVRFYGNTSLVNVTESFRHNKPTLTMKV